MEPLLEKIVLVLVETRYASVTGARIGEIGGEIPAYVEPPGIF